MLTIVLSCSSGDHFERGADRAITASPTTFAFGGVAVGERVTETVTIGHVGESGTLILSAATLITDSPDLEVTGPEPRALEPGQSAILTVSYSPSDARYDQGVVRILHNVPEQPPLDIPIQTVLQTPLLRTEPGVLAFGDVSAGEVRSRDLTVRNDGTLATTIEAIGLDLELGAPFSRTDTVTFPRTLNAHESLTLTLQYAPPHAGDDTVHRANLRFVTDHPATNNQIVSVIGRAREAQLQVTPAIVNFGWVVVGQTEAADVVFKNAGTDPVTVSRLELLGDEALVPLGLKETPFEIAPGQALSVTITFAPTHAIEPTPSLGTLVLETDDFVTPNTTVEIGGAGAEPALTFVPADLADFGVVAVGYQHRRTILAVNQGPVPLTLSGASVSPESADGFEQHGAPEWPVTLAPGGGRAAIDVTFTNPGFSDELVFGRLEVLSDDPVQPTAALKLRARTAALPECLPRFEPASLEFGTVAPGSEKTLSFSLHNDGSMPCTWQSVDFLACAAPSGLCEPIPGSSPAFVQDSPKPTTGSQVFFGEALAVPVRYAPPTDEGQDAAMTVATLLSGPGSGPAFLYHSPLGGELPSMHGSVGTAGIRVTPKDLTFPLTTVGCGAKPVRVALSRIGPQPIAWAGMESSDCDGHFVLGGLPALPAPLFEEAAEAPVEILAQFLPSEEGFVECTTSLLPDVDTAGIGTLRLRGTATPETTRTDYFQQAPEFAVDILFVVDNSGSMQDEQEALVAGFDGFVAQAAVWDVQYHIAVVTTDVGQGKGFMVGPTPYVTNANPEQFKANALVGTSGSGDEQGLLTAWLALQPDKLVDYGHDCIDGFGACEPGQPNSKCIDGHCGGSNQGFLRQDALLAVIWVSDENDHAAAPVETYTTFLAGLKPPGRVKGYAIVGPPTTTAGGGGCGTAGQGFFGPSQAASAGDRYVAVAEALGGFWFSICDFGVVEGGEPPLLEQIGKDAFQPVHSFALSESPAPGSLTLRVNEQPCTEGWSYDADTNAVIFDQSIPTCFPGPNDTISATYEPVCYPSVGQ